MVKDVINRLKLIIKNEDDVFSWKAKVLDESILSLMKAKILMTGVEDIKAEQRREIAEFKLI